MRTAEEGEPPRHRSRGADLAYFGALLVAFVLSRWLYSLAQVPFVHDGMYIFYQLLDPALLRERPLESLWYLHAQPPLLNILVSLALAVSPDSPATPLEALFTLMGFVTCVAVAETLWVLGIRRWLAAGVAISYAATPAFIAYEHWFFYPHLAQALLAAAGCGLVRSRGQPGRWMFVALMALAALVWLRSLFHPIYFFTIALAIVAFVGKRRRRQALITATLPLVLVLGLLSKNYMVFGVWGTTSWTGHNLQRVARKGVEPAVRRQMVHAGALSPLVLLREFDRPERFSRVLRRMADDQANGRKHGTTVRLDEFGDWGVPALDRLSKERVPKTEHYEYPNVHPANYNHWIFLISSRVLLHDTLTLIRAHPEAYGNTVLWNVGRFFDPVSDYSFIEPIVRPIVTGIDAMNAVERSTPYRLLMGFGFLGVILMSCRKRWPRHERVFFGYLAFSITWVFAVSVLAESGENQRFRYQMMALAWVAVAVTLHRLQAVMRREYRSRFNSRTRRKRAPS